MIAKPGSYVGPEGTWVEMIVPEGPALSLVEDCWARMTGGTIQVPSNDDIRSLDLRTIWCSDLSRGRSAAIHSLANQYDLACNTGFGLSAEDASYWAHEGAGAYMFARPGNASQHPGAAEVEDPDLPRWCADVFPAMIVERCSHRVLAEVRKLLSDHTETTFSIGPH